MDCAILRVPDMIANIIKTNAVYVVWIRNYVRNSQSVCIKYTHDTHIHICIYVCGFIIMRVYIAWIPILTCVVLDLCVGVRKRWSLPDLRMLPCVQRRPCALRLPTRRVCDT
jgi:hypothetical protein